MRCTFKTVFYVNGSKERNGIVPIMGRVTINGTIAQFSCKQSVTKAIWDAKGNRAIGKSKEAKEVNLLTAIVLQLYGGTNTFIQKNSINALTLMLFFMRMYRAALIRELFVSDFQALHVPLFQLSHLLFQACYPSPASRSQNLPARRILRSAPTSPLFRAGCR